jgi:hypothetical protein
VAISAPSYVTPIEKVISLVKGLQSEVEEEGKSEAKAYDKFACFCASQTRSKGKSLKDGQNSISALSADIADDTARQTEKESDLMQRKKDDETLKSKLAAEEARCAKEKAEYEAAAADLNKAINSLKDAIGAMKDSKPSLLSIKKTLGTTLEMAAAMNLLKTPKHKATAALLQQSSAVDPLDPEYKYHSDDIIELCEKLLEDYRGSKRDLDSGWFETKTGCEEMQKSLREQIQANQDAMDQLDKEIQKLKTEIAQHREMLIEAQSTMQDDELYLKDLTKRCEDRANDYDQRSVMRADELKALGEALEILTGTVQDATEVNVRAVDAGLLQGDVQSGAEVATKKAGTKDLRPSSQSSQSGAKASLSSSSVAASSKKTSNSAASKSEKLTGNASLSSAAAAASSRSSRTTSDVSESNSDKQVPGYFLTPNHTYCPAGTDVMTEAECRDAAGATGKAYGGPWSALGDHQYCLMANDGRNAVFFNTAGTAAASAPPNPAFSSLCKATAVPIFEYISPIVGDHEYTTRSTPYDPSWKANGVAFYAYSAQVTGTTPIYEFYNIEATDHEYTTRSTPFDPTWDANGIVFYAYSHQVTGTSPIHEYFEPGTMDHEYTMRNTPYNAEWQTKCIAFYAFYPHVQPTPQQQAATATGQAGPDAIGPVSFLQDIRERARSFLGSSNEDQKAPVLRQALEVLRKEGQRLRSTALTTLAAHVSEDPFKKVKRLIQDLIERLLEEARSEATKKGFCDTELGKADKDRTFRFEEVNDLSADIAVLEAKRDFLTQEIKDLKERIDETKMAIEETIALRKEDKEVNMATIKTAREGLAATTEAIVILRRFYKQAAKAFFLQASPVDEDTSGPGFTGSYRGRQSGIRAVFALLETIASDFDRTMRKTQQVEDEEHRDFVDFIQVSEAEVAGNTRKKELNEEDLKTTQINLKVKMSGLQTAMDLLDKALQEIETLKPTCIDTGMSYADRVQKREEEIAALKRALTILQPADD